MKKVMVVLRNKNNLGGPSVAMRKLIDSNLKEKYEFVPYYFLDYVGPKPKFKVLGKLIRDIKKCNPDIVYFTGMQFDGYYPALAAFLAGYRKKSIMVVRGSSCDAISISKWERLYYRYFIEPLCVKLAGTTHTVCTEMANNPIVKNNCKHFGGVIYNMAPLEAVDNYTFSLCRKDLGLRDEDVVLVYTGRITYDKGISYLLDAMKLCEGNTQLLIVGDGREKDEYEKKAEENNISDRVKFLGYREDVLDILNCSDIFVFPTLHENLSNALLEACSVGLPTIATNLGGNPEVIRDNIDGILVKEKSAKALAGAIKRLSADKALREKMGRSAKERMKDTFSSEIILKKIDELFERI